MRECQCSLLVAGAKATALSPEATCEEGLCTVAGVIRASELVLRLALACAARSCARCKRAAVTRLARPAVF